MFKRQMGGIDGLASDLNCKHGTKEAGLKLGKYNEQARKEEEESEEVKDHREKLGKNELPAKHFDSMWEIFVGSFNVRVCSVCDSRLQACAVAALWGSSGGVDRSVLILLLCAGSDSDPAHHRCVDPNRHLHHHVCTDDSHLPALHVFCCANPRESHDLLMMTPFCCLVLH